MTAPLVITLLGAESTGKTTLCLALADRLRQQGLGVVVVPEVLREWCAREGRTPRADEQRAIADEQIRRIASATTADVVLADAGPLMVAIYSNMLFNDASLYPVALTAQQRSDLTLVMGLDLPWVADGLQRDGPHVRAPVDALLRAALGRGGIRYSVVYGAGDARLDNAWRSLISRLPPLLKLKLAECPAAFTAPPPAPENPALAASWFCDTCSDPDCEHRLFTGLLQRDSLNH